MNAGASLWRGPIGIGSVTNVDTNGMTNVVETNGYAPPVETFNFPGRIGGDLIDPNFNGVIDDWYIFRARIRSGS